MKKITLLVAFLLSFVGYAQLSEDFESGTFPPTGWQVLNNGVGSPTLNWVASTTSTFLCTQGSNSPTVAYMNRETGIPAGQNAEDWLITKQVNLTGMLNIQLRFWNKMTLAGVNGTNYKIYVKSTPGAPTGIADFPSTPFAQWSEDDFYDGVIDNNPGITPFNACFEKIVSLNAYAGQQIYIAFVMDLPGGSNSRDRWVLDDVKVEETCFDPTGLAIGATTLTSADITFTPNSGETQWEYFIVSPPGGAGPNASSTGVVFTGGSPHTITTLNDGVTPLTVDTNYEVYIRANCISGSKSGWVGPVAFKTRKYGEKCEAPITVLPSALPYQTNDNTSTYLNDYSGSAGGCGTAGTYLNGNDVAYQITPDFTGFLNIRLTPATSADQGSGVFVYTSCANVGNTCLAGVSNGGSGVRLISNLPVTAGTTYTIIISSLGSGSSPVSVNYNLFIERVYCDAPTGLAVAGITSSGANLSWAAGTATSWDVAVQSAGGPNPPTVVTATGLTSSTYTAGGLNHTTAYEYYVRAACGDGTFSPWAGPFPFTTACGTYTTPYTETFNSTPVNSLSEACWSVVNTNGGQAWSMNYVFNPYEGNHSASLNTATGSTHDDWLISPKLNITSNKRIRFRYRVGVATAASGFEMKLSTTNNNPSDFTTVILPVATYTNTEYLEKIVYLNAYSGDVYVSFHVPNGIGGTTGSRIYIDEVIFEDIPACPMPLAPSASAPTIDGATLAWTQGFQETNWDIVVQAPTAAAPTATTTPTHTSTAPTLAVTGLANGTDYCYYVRANCGATQSEWVGPICFKTLLCNVADKCNYVFSMTDTGANGWNGNTMNVVQDGDIIAVIGGTFTAGAGPVNVSVPLCPNEPFSLVWNAAGTNPDQVAVTIFDPYNEEVYVKNAGDGFQGTTLHTSVVDCNPPLCLKPQNLTCPPAGVTQTTAVIGWTEMGTATLWEYKVQPQGDPPPTSGILTNGTPAPAAPVYTENVGSLTPATLYEFWVRAVCGGANGNSDWKGPFKFVTKIANDECSTATTVPVNPNHICNQTTHGLLIGATASSQPLAGCAGVADDDVWFQFTATETTHYISLINVIGSTSVLNFVVYSGSCTAPTFVFCEADAGDNVGIVNGLTPGNNYFIRVYSSVAGAQTTQFDLCVASLSTCSNSEPFCSDNPVTYPNITGVPSPGSIGCLSTAPNPTYYYLEVQSSGPLLYNLSQVSTTGNPIDVDYVAWGPYPSKAVACASINATNTLPDGDPPGGTALHGCSYSAAAVEYMYIPNALAGEIYVVLITNFNGQAGTITFEQGNTSDPGAGYTACCPNPTFTYPTNSYCKTNANVLPTTTEPNGTFAASPTGLVINTSTGEIDFANSLPNTYTITYSFPITATCPAGSTDDFTLTISAPQTANFSYAGSPFCIAVGATVSPIFGTGSVAGNFTVDIAGLVIDASTGVINLETSAAGTYVVTNTIGAIGACPQVQQQTTVVVGTSLQADFIYGSAAYCKNATNPTPVYSGGGQAGTFSSSPAGVIFTTTPGEIDLTATPAGVYTISNVVAASGGCSGETVTFEVTIKDVPTASISANPTTICDGGTSTVTITGNAGATVTYTDGTNTPTVTLDASGTYTITHSSSLGTLTYTLQNVSLNGCSQALTNSATVTVVTMPTANIVTTNTEICDGTPINVDFTGTPGAEVTYTINGGANQTVTLAGSGNYSLAHSGGTKTYTLVSVSLGTCSQSLTGSVTITVKPIPTASISANPTTICDGGTSTVTITGNAGATVTYTDGTNTPTVTLDASGTYTITHPSSLGTLTYTLQNVSLNGCSQALTNIAMVTVITMPTASIVTTNTEICAGSAINIDFVGTAGAAVTYNDGSGNQTVTLDGSGNYSLAHSGGTKTYTLVSVSLGTCNQSLTGSVTITVKPIPTASISASPTTICDGSSSTVTITGNPNAVVTYNFNGGANQQVTLSAAGNYTINHSSSLGSGAYTLTDVSLNGCGQAPTSSATVTVNPMPDVTISGTNGVCFGQSSIVTFTGTIGATVTYTINGGANQTITIGSSGNATLTHSGGTATYALVSVAKDGCSKAVSGSATITIGSELVAGLTGDCINNKFTLQATPLNPTSGSALYSYSWLNPSLAIVGTNSSMLEADQTGIYTVTITRLSDNCSGSAIFTVENISCNIQKGISPNGDGKNDTFDLRGMNVSHLTIYNRYGKQVYTRFNYANEWSGQTSEGDELPDGTYYYMIERTNGESLTGWVYINRSN